MADSKITDLASGTPATAADVFLIARAGVNYKLTHAQLMTMASGTQLISTGGGSASAPALALAAATNNGIYWTSNPYLAIAYGNDTKLMYNAGTPAAIMLSTWQHAWSTNVTGTAPDAGLARSQAGIVKITDGSTGLGNLLLSGNIYWGSGADTQLRRIGAAELRVSDLSTGLGYLTSGIKVTANTGTATPAIGDSGTLYTNTGDADGSIVTLPDNPTVGTTFKFAVTVAQTLTVNAASGETIQDAAASGTSIVADAVGEWLELVAVTGGSGAMWMVMGKAGTWTLS